MWEFWEIFWFLIILKIIRSFVTLLQIFFMLSSIKHLFQYFMSFMVFYGNCCGCKQNETRIYKYRSNKLLIMLYSKYFFVELCSKKVVAKAKFLPQFKPKSSAKEVYKISHWYLYLHFQQNQLKMYWKTFPFKSLIKIVTFYFSSITQTSLQKYSKPQLICVGKFYRNPTQIF